MDKCKKQSDFDFTESMQDGKCNGLDLISRLSDLRSQYSCFNECERDTYNTLSEAIKVLQERKTGKWIYVECIDGEGLGAVAWKCSECGEIYIYDYNYCPNCGVKMEGE